MTVTNVEKDTERLTLRLTAEFAAPVERVWRLWEDPRQLERWWGPPGYPATFVEHDFKGGGAVTYYMTSPEGETHYGWWRITEIDAPSRLEFEDGFGDSDGKAQPRHADHGERRLASGDRRRGLSDQDDSGNQVPVGRGHAADG